MLHSAPTSRTLCCCSVLLESHGCMLFSAPLHALTALAKGQTSSELTYLLVQGEKQRQQPQRQQQTDHYEEAGRPRVWVPGQGWVAIDPDWEQQEDAAPLAEQEGQQTLHRGRQEEAKAGSSQIRIQGHTADSRREGSNVRGLALNETDQAEAGSNQADESQRSEVGDRLQEAKSDDAGSSDAVMTSEEYAIGEQHEVSKPQKQRQGESDEQACTDQREQEQSGMQEEQADHQDQADTGLEDGQQTNSSIVQHDIEQFDGQEESSKQDLQGAEGQPGNERQRRQKVNSILLTPGMCLQPHAESLIASSDPAYSRIAKRSGR